MTSPSATRYGQLDATIFTDSTFSLGAFAADAAGGCVVADGERDAVEDVGSTVPVISTLWPTCGVNKASSAASNRYSLATAVLGTVPAVPAVPAVAAVLEPLVLIAAFVNRNFVSLAGLVAPTVPLVPVGICSVRWTQPVTEMLLAGAVVVDGADEGGCACASSPTVTPETTAIHAPDQSLHCIICLLLFGAWTAGCNHQTETSTLFRVTERHQKPPRSGIRFDQSYRSSSTCIGACHRPATPCERMTLSPKKE